MFYIKLGPHYFSKFKIVNIEIKSTRNKFYVMNIKYVHPHVQYNPNSNQYNYLSTMNFKIDYHTDELLKSDCRKILSGNPNCEVNNSVEELVGEINLITNSNKLYNNE